MVICSFCFNFSYMMTEKVPSLLCVHDYTVLSNVLIFHFSYMNGLTLLVLSVLSKVSSSL